MLIGKAFTAGIKDFSEKSIAELNSVLSRLAILRSLNGSTMMPFLNRESPFSSTILRFLVSVSSAVKST